MPQRIIVTGAAGLVGRAVVGLLNARGDEAIAMDREGGLRIGDVTVAGCDLRNVHRLHALARGGVAGVIHCGAFSGPMVARDDPVAMFDVNIGGTANMLELARVHGARRFVYCSSTSAYGDTPPGPVREDVVLAPASLYGASKVCGEQLVSAYARQYGVDGVSLRLSWVYGPHRTTDCMIRRMLTDAMAKRPTRVPFGLDFHRQYIHVDDAAAALVAALDAPLLPRRTYNVTGGSRATLGEVAAVVRRVVPGADIELAPGPDPLDEHQERFDISAAVADLAYRPRFDLEAGIRAYAQWLAARAAPSA
ncbi:NAD(P)-dependent oxidoreductase [Paraburkholderia fungorum]|uniref:NAD(P)-dependent oxidoreductase n=1 Tax=Paraburkholderia fungorum TaxID=134537 RepID=A0AAP5V0P9_9BURK|nr:NAD(P)-dependent oxidoreductase [Paraburkholderia fungorum]MDT8843584.1 NAD(P)-dependent oxidoreductase [Paraburkholderia fungorum]